MSAVARSQVSVPMPKQHHQGLYKRPFVSALEERRSLKGKLSLRYWQAERSHLLSYRKILVILNLLWIHQQHLMLTDV